MIRDRTDTDSLDMAPCAVTTTAETTADRNRSIVTGAKVFASDFRPRDLGWGCECAHALLLRASYTDRPFKRVDCRRMPQDLRPASVVTAKDLREAGIRNHITAPHVELLVPEGRKADYLGQPVALFLYGDFMRFRRAAQELREDSGPIVYGEPTCDARPDEEIAQWTRFEFTGKEHPQTHYLLDADVPGGGYSQRTRRRLTTKDNFDQEANDLIAGLEAEFARPHAPHVETTTYTQQVDPAFLEPEAGVAWFNRDQATLHLVLGTQSPHGDQDEIKVILRDANPTVRQALLEAKDCGGSFGGRDKSPFAFYLALAAYFCGTPVRLAFDRREQFQGGLKRHASAVHSWIRLDEDKRLVARSFVVLRGGVEVNLNRAVLGLAALHATGPYRLARAGVHGIVLQRAIPTVGSMRGFGIPQVAFNIETAFDRLAVLKLGEDPIKLRLDCVIRTQDGSDPPATDLAGTPLRFHVAAADVCKAALEHELWTSRPRQDRNSAEPVWAEDGTLYGVGFASCMEAYGTSEDSIYCAVKVAPDGQVHVWSQTAEVGQGARRSLEAVARQCLGAQGPVKVHLDAVDWFEAFEDKLVAQHRDSKISFGHGASAASKTAFFHTHVLREACRALLRLRLLPAARTMRDLSALTDKQLLDAWSNGALRLPEHQPVRLAELAAAADTRERPSGVMVHGYFCDGWSRATFSDGDVTLKDVHIDALGFACSPSEPVEPLPPDGPLTAPPGAEAKNKPPRSLYAAGAHLVAVRIEPERGRIRVVRAVTFLDAGDMIVEDVVDGQVEGGLAMGIAHTLFEELPTETGTGPFVNFDRYRLPRWDDLRDIHRQTVDMPLPCTGVLGPGEPDVRHKGIGEVTMTTVAPAIGNAIAHALGHIDDGCWPTRTPIRLTDLTLPPR